MDEELEKALLGEYAKLEEIPEGARGFFAENDGKVALTETGSMMAAQIRRNQDLQTQIKTLQGVVDAGGSDPKADPKPDPADSPSAKKQATPEESEPTKQEPAASNPDPESRFTLEQLRSFADRRAREVEEKKNQEIEGMKKQVETARGEMNDTLLKVEALNAATALKLDPELCQRYLLNEIKNAGWRIEKGEPILYRTEDNTPVYADGTRLMTLQAWLAKPGSLPKSFYPASVGGGSGKTTGGIGPAGPRHKNDFPDMETKLKFIKENSEAYQKLPLQEEKGA